VADVGRGWVLAWRCCWSSIRGDNKAASRGHDYRGRTHPQTHRKSRSSSNQTYVQTCGTTPPPSSGTVRRRPWRRGAHSALLVMAVRGESAVPSDTYRVHGTRPAPMTRSRKIAKKYGTSVSTILRLQPRAFKRRVWNINKLPTGQILRLPRRRR